MRVLAISQYDRLGASSRVRVLQYRGAFERAGVEISFEPFLRDRYLERLYTGQSVLAEAVRAYCTRVVKTFSTGAAGAIWLEKEAFPWLPYGLERVLMPRGMPIISDYDDAVFHRYDLHRSRMVRGLLGCKIDQVMAGSTLVMAGNQYLAARARDAGAPWVEIVPTVVDLDAYHVRPEGREETRGTIGWIGSPSTWREYMVPLMPMLSDLAGECGSRMLVVGGGPDVSVHAHLDAVSWTEDGEIGRIHEMDIGIMPLDDSPWARGKCGYKLIQYMACGLPVVASPVGVNVEIVEHGVDGFLASTAEEWRDALTTLLRNPELRARMGRAGRRKVEAGYSLQVWGPRVVALLKQAAKKGGRCST